MSQTLPRDGKSAEYFPRNYGERVFHRAARCHAFAVKKPRLAARKIAQIRLASSLPQDSSVQLMFGAARFGEPALNVLRGLGFHFAPRRAGSPQRRGMPRNCFNRQRILDQTRRLASL